MPCLTPTGICFALLAALAFAFASTTAPAQPDFYDPYSQNLPTDLDSADLEITYTFGFDGTIWQNAITPVTFQIKNISPEFFTGFIEIDLGRYASTTHRIPIEIGQNSLRRFSFGINFPSYLDSVELRIVRDGEIRWRRASNNLISNIFSKTVPALTADGPRPTLAISPDHTKAPPEDESDGRSLPRNSVLRIAPWELPDHDQILSPLAGIFFSQTTDFRALTGARLTALARYLAHGGTLFVPADASTWMQKLADELPYEITVAIDKPTPVGLGLLVPFTGDPNSAPWGRRDLLAILSSRPAPNYAGHFQSHQFTAYDQTRGPRSQTSITAITLFVVAYLVAAGPLLFFFRRAKRKNIIRLLVLLIGAASFLSIALGIYLRSSRGDLTWASVTQVGEGGATQTAILFLSSAGARTHHIECAVPSAAIDPFDILLGRHFYPSIYRNSDQSLGVVYQNSITAPVALGSTDITLTPLGQKQSHARGPIAGVKPIEISTPSPAITPIGQGQSLSLTATFKNPNPFPLVNPLVIHRIKNDVYSGYLTTIPAGGSISGTYPLTNRTDPDSFQRQLQSYNPPGPRAPRPLLAPWLPHIHLQDKATITLLASLPKSPAFQFSGDFVDSQSTHYLLQDIALPPETNTQ